MIDLFAPLHAEERLHPNFKQLRDSHFMAPARAMLKEICENFHDADGNFVEQFQTFGLDARTFELFLHAMFTDSGYSIDRKHPYPDFGLERDGRSVWVEAVTANPSPSGSMQPYAILSEDGKKSDYANEIPIRLGSPLYSKLKKKY